VLLRLVQLGDGTTTTRRQQARAARSTAGDAPEDIDAVAPPPRVRLVLDPGHPVRGYADRVSDRDKPDLVHAPPGELTGEPPVVARLIVEIRSDGSRTIARGAMEDVATGQRTLVEARGDSPLQLALALARSLGQLPRLGARSAIRGLLGKRRNR
jgi:hypothetical protein